MGDTVRPEALRSLAKELDSQLEPLLDQAKKAFDASDVAGSAFSTEGLELQIIYPGTRQFAMQDVASKQNELMTVHDNLILTADEWELAEQHSVIHLPGGLR